MRLTDVQYPSDGRPMARPMAGRWTDLGWQYLSNGRPTDVCTVDTVSYRADSHADFGYRLQMCCLLTTVAAFSPPVLHSRGVGIFRSPKSTPKYPFEGITFRAIRSNRPRKGSENLIAKKLKAHFGRNSHILGIVSFHNYDIK